MSEEVEQITKTPLQESVKTKEKDPKKVAAGKKLAEYNRKAKEALKEKMKREAEKEEERETGESASARGWIPETSFTTAISLVGIGLTAINMFMSYKTTKVPCEPPRVKLPESPAIAKPQPPPAIASKIPVPKMGKEKIFKTIYDASFLIGISSGFGYFVNLYDPSTSLIDYLKWVGILSGSIYLKDYMQREEILKKIDSLNSKKETQATTLGAIASKEKTPKNLDLKLKRIINLANPVGDRDGANKSYVDEKVKTLVNSLVSKKGDLDMGGNEIHNVKTQNPQTSVTRLTSIT